MLVCYTFLFQRHYQEDSANIETYTPLQGTHPTPVLSYYVYMVSYLAG
jgi:hypothetical protein